MKESRGGFTYSRAMKENRGGSTYSRAMKGNRGGFTYSRSSHSRWVKQIGSLKLTGMAILERSLPMHVFITDHSEIVASSLKGTLDRRATTADDAVIESKRALEANA